MRKGSKGLDVIQSSVLTSERDIANIFISELVNCQHFYSERNQRRSEVFLSLDKTHVKIGTALQAMDIAMFCSTPDNQTRQWRPCFRIAYFIVDVIFSFFLDCEQHRIIELRSNECTIKIIYTKYTFFFVFNFKIRIRAVIIYKRCVKSKINLNI